MSKHPRTQAIIDAADACPETRLAFLIKSLGNLAMQLEEENFTLAAGQCIHGIKGDEGGTPYCPRIRELERDVIEAQDIIGSTEELAHHKSPAAVPECGKLNAIRQEQHEATHRDAATLREMMRTQSNAALARWVLKNLDWTGGNSKENEEFLAIILGETWDQAKAAVSGCGKPSPLEDFKTIREEEIAEFNGGMDAFLEGVAYSDLPDVPNDQNGVGWAWAWFLKNRPDLAVRSASGTSAEVSIKSRALLLAAKELRSAQRDYMANRGNEEKGRVVAEKAKVLDTVIEHAEAALSTTGTSAAEYTRGREDGFDAGLLKAAQMIERLAEERVHSTASYDSETGAWEYPKHAEDVGNALDEEAEDCVKAIRAIVPPAQERT